MSNGISIATNLLANNISYNLGTNENSLKKLSTELSTGLRINSPSDDPAGYATAQRLTGQIQGYQSASQNIQQANNAAQIASGSLSNITSILQQVRSLAVQASSSLQSSSNLTSIQSEINQLVNEVNGIAQSTSFNGQNLLDGSVSGYVPASNASASITQNAVLSSSGSNLVASVTYTATDTTLADGTFQFQVIQSGSTIATEVFYISSGNGGLAGTLLTTISGPVATSYAYNDVTITINAVGTADIGATSFVKVLKYVTAGAATTPQITVQTGPNPGQGVSFGINGVTASKLRISGLNVIASNSSFNTLAAQDTVSQVDSAISQVLAAQSSLGAAQLRLGFETDADNLAVVNLQASKSAITDLNVGQASSDYTRTELLVNFGVSLLAQANNSAASVLQLFR